MYMYMSQLNSLVPTPRLTRFPVLSNTTRFCYRFGNYVLVVVSFIVIIINLPKPSK